ncbi:MULTISPECIES: glycoside hydrolase family 140 protein [Olivibacter]|uniref:Glycoside hydrolase family 140 protein n=1 Tax=Olivibacter jilunii TaxID=985016 RepID=A0ABW6ASN7_9SPHI
MQKNKFKLLIIVQWLLLPQLLLGQLHISANHRYLAHNNKPFLWIGDTAWELFHKLNVTDAEYYLETRAEQGFTVIQAVILSENNGLRTPNYYGERPLHNLNPETPNEAYFKHIDRLINKAEQLGLYMALLPTWGDKVKSNRPGQGPVIFNKENAYTYGKYLGKRYQNKPVIWMLGGDRNVADTTVVAIWKSMATGIQDSMGSNAIISYHPAGESSSSHWFHNESWLSFNSYQSGHARPYFPVYNFASYHYSIQPLKPFIDVEPAYEDIPIRFWDFIRWDGKAKLPNQVVDADGFIRNKEYFKQGYFTDYDVRVHAYWNILSGACGYTYGNNAIWQFFSAGDSTAIPCLYDWKTALHRPGAKSMSALKNLFELRSFAKLVPDTTMILSEYGKDSTYISAARANDYSFALVYAAIGQSLRIDLTGFKSTVRAQWYQPKDGRFLYIGEYSNRCPTTFTPPTQGRDQDWLLVLDEKKHFK